MRQNCHSIYENIKYHHFGNHPLIHCFFSTGACHGDDLTSLFYMTSLGSDNSLKSGTTEYLLMQRMTKIWTDFAKTG